MHNSQPQEVCIAASGIAGKVKKSKKGKKPAADMDAVFAALNSDEDTVPADTQANGLDHGTQDLAAPSPGMHTWSMRGNMCIRPWYSNPRYCDAAI